MDAGFLDHHSGHEQLQLRNFIEEQFLAQADLLKEISLQLTTAIGTAAVVPIPSRLEEFDAIPRPPPCSVHPKPIHEQAVPNEGGEFVEGQLASVLSPPLSRAASGVPESLAASHLSQEPTLSKTALNHRHPLDHPDDHAERIGMKLNEEREDENQEELITVLKDQQKRVLRTLRSASVLSDLYGHSGQGSNTIQQIAHRVVSSVQFGYGIMLLIVVNMVIMGIEVDTVASLRLNEEPEWFSTVNNVIVGIFTCELVLKFTAFGCAGFFCGREKWWNIFDLAIVGASIIETLTDLISKGLASQNGEAMNSSHLRIMRFTRVARALRGVRVFRLLRFISALRAIIFSISSTMWSLVWTLVLLVILFYCFGVILAQLVSDFCRYQRFEDETLWADGICLQKDLQRWSGVPESMMTLFMSISGGLSWEDALIPLREVSALAAACMIVFIVITVFAVMNVVTGVFCNTAIENAKADKDIAIMKQMHKHAAQVEVLRAVFTEIDTRKSKQVSMPELKEAMSEKKLASFMESMDISTKDIWTLFMLLDADESGEISLEEFVSGCMQLEGPAKSIHLAKMRYENNMLRQDVSLLAAQISSLRNELRGARSVPPSIAEIYSPKSS